MADLSPAAQAIVEALKSKAKVIDGVPYMPTGFEGKSASELLDAVNASYSKIVKATIGTNANAAGLNPGATRNNAVIPAPLTSAPASTTNILPNYSKEEIEAVAKQAVDECEIRSAVPNILDNIQLSEAIDAKCDIKPPAPFLPAEFLPDTPFEPEPEPEPEDALAPPKYTLVTLVSLDGLTANGNEYAEIKVIKNDGDKVSCGETIMEVGGIAVTCPVVDGIVKKIITKDKGVKNSQLFVVEEPNPVDTSKKVFAEADNLKKKIDEMILLKERLGVLEPQVWHAKTILGIFEGQYQGYIAYYQKFNDLITQRNTLNDEFIENRKKLEDLFYTYTFTTTTEAKAGVAATTTTNTEKFILPNDYNSNKKKQITELLARQTELVTSIGNVTSQLDAVRAEQPTYFALDKTKEVNASVTSVPYTKGVKGSQYTIIPFKSGDKLSSPYIDILTGLPAIIEPFTNNILLAGRYFDRWTDIPNPLQPRIHFDINQKDIFSYNTLIRVQTSPTDYDFEVKGGARRWAGSMWKTRYDFFNTATAVSKGIKPADDPDTVTQKTGDLSLQERALPAVIEKLATDNYDAVVEYCKNFGYYLLNDGSIFIQNGKNKTTELDKKRQDAQAAFKKLHDEYVIIRKKIVETEIYIDSFPNIIKSITTSGCAMVGGGPASVGKYEGKKTKIIPWPFSDGGGGAGAPADNDKENGNPDPKSPPATSLAYWKKYCKRATTVNLLPTYWPIGIIIPTPSGLIKIPFPIIWTPLAVIPSDLALIVIGITMCGICPGPFIYIVNPGWPFPIGMVKAKESWFVVGNRGPKNIDSITTSEVSALDIPTVNIPLKYTKNGQTVKTNVKINVGPIVTQLLPFIQDDLPVYERLTMTNVVYLLYLAKWCKQGKNTYGFFTS
jgi:hypothetical protein